jgi:hypothetical protein
MGTDIKKDGSRKSFVNRSLEPESNNEIRNLSIGINETPRKNSFYPTKSRPNSARSGTSTPKPENKLTKSSNFKFESNLTSNVTDLLKQIASRNLAENGRLISENLNIGEFLTLNVNNSNQLIKDSNDSTLRSVSSRLENIKLSNKCIFVHHFFLL